LGVAFRSPAGTLTVAFHAAAAAAQVTTIGYGDITPQTTLEVAVAAMFMLVGGERGGWRAGEEPSDQRRDACP
jgi:hypothetical protein